MALLICFVVLTVCVSHTPPLWVRLQIWLPPQYRIGEASNPGPEVFTCNSHSWKTAQGLLTKAYDLVPFQETLLVKDKLAGEAPFVT
eukprot:6462948-Amphidinium_carterae.2